MTYAEIERGLADDLQGAAGGPGYSHRDLDRTLNDQRPRYRYEGGSRRDQAAVSTGSPSHERDRETPEADGEHWFLRWLDGLPEGSCLPERVGHRTSLDNSSSPWNSKTSGVEGIRSRKPSNGAEVTRRVLIGALVAMAWLASVRVISADVDHVNLPRFAVSVR